MCSLRIKAEKKVVFDIIQISVLQELIPVFVVWGVTAHVELPVCEDRGAGRCFSRITALFKLLLLLPKQKCGFMRCYVTTSHHFLLETLPPLQHVEACAELCLRPCDTFILFDLFFSSPPLWANPLCDPHLFLFISYLVKVMETFRVYSWQGFFLRWKSPVCMCDSLQVKTLLFRLPFTGKPDDRGRWHMRENDSLLIQAWHWQPYFLGLKYNVGDDISKSLSANYSL